MWKCTARPSNSYLEMILWDDFYFGYVWVCLQIQAPGTRDNSVNHCYNKAFIVFGLVESLSCWLNPILSGSIPSSAHVKCPKISGRPFASHKAHFLRPHLYLKSFQFEIYIIVHWNFGYPTNNDLKLRLPYRLQTMIINDLYEHGITWWCSPTSLNVKDRWPTTPPSERPWAPEYALLALFFDATLADWARTVS